MEPALWFALTFIATITPIVITLIKENAATERLRMSLGASENTAANEIAQNGSANRRVSSSLGLLAVIMASLQQGVFVFGQQASVPLDAGSAASIAQSLCLFASGVWLLSR